MSRKLNPTHIDRSNIDGEWLLDGDAKDTSGNGNDGTATDVTYVSADRGYVEEVASFNGTSSYIDFGTGFASGFSAAGTWEVNLQVYPTTAGTDDTIWQSATGSTNRSIFSVDDSNVFKVGLYTGTWDSVEHTFPSYNRWYNVSFGAVSGVSFIYVDTVEDTTVSDGASSSGTVRTVLGATCDRASRFFPGRIGMYRYTTGGTFSDEERELFFIEGLRKLGPTNRANLSQGFPFYTLPSLPKPILEISKAQSGGVYYDQTGNGNNGTPTSVTDTALGKYNVMSFNGSNSRINLGSSLGLSDVRTVLFTLDVSSTVTNQYILDLGTTGNLNNYSWGRIRLKDSTFDFGYVSNAGSVENGVRVNFDTTNKKVRCIFVFSGTRTYGDISGFKCYINGVPQTIIDDTTGTSYGYPSISGDSHIGKFSRSVLSDTNFLNGDLIDFEICDTDITDEEAQQDFYSSKII